MPKPNTQESQAQVWATITRHALPFKNPYKLAGMALLPVDISKRKDIQTLATAHRRGIAPDFDYLWSSAFHKDKHSILLKVTYDAPHECELELIFTMPDHYNFLQSTAETGVINLVNGDNYLFSLEFDTTTLKQALNLATVFMMVEGGLK